MKHIVLNAHLLSQSAGYRKAGIHRYMYGQISQLPYVDKGDFTYTALANHQISLDHPRFQSQVSTFDTNSPAKRILWEQVVQPVALNRLKPDLYHALAFVGSWTMPAPSVVTVFDLSFIRYPEVLTRARRLYLQRMTAYSCRKATRVLAISQSTANDLTDYLAISPDKIDIAYPGVSPDFKPLPAEDIEQFRQSKNLPENFLLFVGTLEPRKNLPLLLRAYAKLSSEERSAMHLVLGGGKGWFYDEIFATIAELGLQETVHLPGYLKAEELVLWYNAASAFVYPTLFEGFGIPIVEALACGKAVLTSNISSLPEAAGDVGVLLPPDDETAWTHALQKTIAEQGHLAEDAAKRMAWARQFTWERCAEDTVACYHKALNA